MVSETASPAAPRARVRHQNPFFFLGMALLCAAIVFVGFAPSYFLRAFSNLPPLTLLVHLHGLVFSAWIGLFVLQSALVRSGRRALHRRLGVLGAMLALSMVWLAPRWRSTRRPLAWPLED